MNKVLKSSLFPGDQKTQKKFSYKNRTQLHPLRPVNVPKDEKDVRLQKKIVEKKVPQKSKVDQIQKRAPVAKKSTQSSAPTLAEAVSQNPKSVASGSVTLTDDQFSKILNLLTINAQNSSTSIPVSNILSQSSVSTNPPPTSSEETGNISKPSEPEPRIETPVIDKIETERPSSRAKTAMKQQATAMQSAFVIGGDGAPNLNSIEERRKKALEEWKKDLEIQRKEQMDAKAKEKRLAKETKMIEHDWTENIKTEVKIENLEKRDSKNESTSNKNSGLVMESKEILAKPSVKIVKPPSPKNPSPGGYPYWSSEKDEKQKLKEKRDRQQEILREQLNEQTKLKLLKKQHEKELLEKEDARIKLEQEMLNTRYLIESGKQNNQDPQVSIAKAIKEKLSPRVSGPAGDSFPVKKQIIKTSSDSSSKNEVFTLENNEQKVLSARSAKFDESAKKMHLDLDFDEKTLAKIKETGKITIDVDVDKLTTVPRNVPIKELPINNADNVDKQQKVSTKKEQIKNVPKTKRKWGQPDPKSSFIPATQKTTKYDQEARKLRIKARQEELLKQQELNARRLKKISKPKKDEQNLNENKEPIQYNAKNAEPVANRLPTPLNLDPNPGPLVVNKTSEVYLSPKSQIEKDVLKNRDRQQKILQEISQLRMGLMRKRNEIFNE